MKIPQFLFEMSKQLNEQDNRCTADPIWQVRCKRTRPTDPRFSDEFEIYDNAEMEVVACSNAESEVNEQIVDYLQCDENDLPIDFEAWVDAHTDDTGEGELTGAEKIVFFIENFDPQDHELYEFDLIWVEEYEDIVKSAFLTQQGAEWFINRKQHDFPPLYTYVASMYHCPQMIELRNWIKGLQDE